MKIFSKALFGLVVVMVLGSHSAGACAAVAGRVQYVHGRVQLTTATGVTHAVEKGDAVNEGDTLVSSQTASAQIRMMDGGMVAMRPDTRLKIDRFAFDGQEDGTERSFFSVFQGGFRAITGQIGKKNKVNYHITTPATTIGIRGTDHEIFVVTPDSPLAAGTPAGTYNKVNLGETSMTTEKGTIFVLPNQMGFAGAADQMPELLPVNLDIFTVTQPAIQDRGNRHEGRMGNGSESDGRGVHGTEMIEKEGMRDVAPVDNKIENHDAETMEESRTGGAAALTPTTEDSVNSTIPTTTDEMLEQHH